MITLFQRSSDDSYRGRVFGALSALEGISVLAGTLGAGYLSRLAGIVPVLAIQGAGYVVAGLVVFLCLAALFGLLQTCAFLIPYRDVLVRVYGPTLALWAAARI